MIIHASVVKEARSSKGWTQQQLADVSGLSLRTIQRVESQGQGSMETCNALCAVLNLELSALRDLDTAKQEGAYSRSFMIAIVAAITVGFLSGVVITLLLQ